MSHYALVQLRVVQFSSVKSKSLAGFIYKVGSADLFGFGISTC